MEGDRPFHAAVAAAAHSSLLAGFMRSIAEQIAAWQPRQAATAMRRHGRTVAKVRSLDREPGEEGQPPPERDGESGATRPCGEGTQAPPPVPGGTKRRWAGENATSG